jgi:hypothetical protein
LTVRQEAHSLGIARATLKRAKRRLGVVSKKCGEQWKWERVASNKYQVTSEAAGGQEVNGRCLAPANDQRPTTNDGTAVLQSPDHRITRSSDDEDHRITRASDGEITRSPDDVHGPLEPLARTVEDEEEEYRAYLVERADLVNDYLERTGQREPFKTNYGIDSQRLGAHFRPLYELIDRVAALNRPQKVPANFVARSVAVSRQSAAAGSP